MFNSPIGRLFGVSGIGQERNRQQSKKDNESNPQNEEQNLFEDENALYSDFSTEELDIELYVRKFFDDLLKQEISVKSRNKVEEFLNNFNRESFEQKHGKCLSKEDLLVILYSLADKFGIGV